MSESPNELESEIAALEAKLRRLHAEEEHVRRVTSEALWTQRHKELLKDRFVEWASRHCTSFVERMQKCADEAGAHVGWKCQDANRAVVNCLKWHERKPLFDKWRRDEDALCRRRLEVIQGERSEEEMPVGVNGVDDYRYVPGSKRYKRSMYNVVPLDPDWYIEELRRAKPDFTSPDFSIPVEEEVTEDDLAPMVGGERIPVAAYERKDDPEVEARKVAKVVEFAKEQFRRANPESF